MPVYQYRIVREKVCDQTPAPIKNHAAVKDYALQYCYNQGDLWREQCFAIFTGKDNVPLGHFLVSVGLESRCLIEPKPVIEAAILSHASHVCLVHNHPSGSPAPSSYDIEQTARLQNALSLMGLTLLDHVILSDKGLYSFHKESVINA